MKYEQNLDLSVKPEGYYTQIRAEMIKYIPKDAKRMLEVGCGEGVFGWQLKQRPHTEVWGVEINERMASVAKERLDNVLIGDINELLHKLPNGYFDCIVCNDLLEHLVDPFSLLSEIKQKTSSQGVLVCSLPNVRYYPMLRELLIQKQWKYVNAGILDKTHLRFFTQKSIVDMFETLGFEIMRMEGINPIESRRFSILNFLLLGYLSDARYLQFACVVKPK